VPLDYHLLWWHWRTLTDHGVIIPSATSVRSACS